MRIGFGLLFCVLATAALADGRPPAPPGGQLAAPGKAGWVVDTRSGCWLWNGGPPQDIAVSWSGGCGPDGPASGKGVVEWTFDGGKVSRFEGEMKLGRATGRGTFTWPNGSRYDGDWKDGMRTGEGTIVWFRGDQYEGGWLNGNRSGQGTYTFANGSYVGEWTDDRPNGQGEAVLDGESYKGLWIMGCFNHDGRTAHVALKSTDSCE